MAKRLITFSNKKGVHVNLSRVSIPVELHDHSSDSSHSGHSESEEMLGFPFRELVSKAREIGANFNGYQIGDIIPQGIIFYVTESEYYVTTPNSIGVKKYGCADKTNATSGSNLGDGFSNSQYLLNNCPDEDSAVFLCNRYTQNDTESEGEWWLPSAQELFYMQTAGLLQSDKVYISSTEDLFFPENIMLLSNGLLERGSKSIEYEVIPVKTVPKTDNETIWIPILYHLTDVNGSGLTSKHLNANMSTTNEILRKESFWPKGSYSDQYASTSVENQTGYLTGYQIPNPDKEGEIIDEVRRWPIDNKKCNIQFFLPGRYKFEWLDPILGGIEGLAFTLQEYKDHPDAPNSIKNLPTPEEWLSFGTNPGIILWREEWFTEENLFKLNALSKSIKGHNIELVDELPTLSIFNSSSTKRNINSRVTNTYPSHNLLSSIGWNSSSSSANYLRINNIFNKERRGTSILHDDLDNIRFMHETLHALGSLSHDFLTPRIQTSIGVGASPHQNSTFYDSVGNENENLFDNKLLPPFAFEYKNHMYKFAQDFLEEAEADVTQQVKLIEDQGIPLHDSTNPEVQVLHKLMDRQSGALQELNNTLEILTGDFELPGGNIHTNYLDEIKYIENVFKIPSEYTSGFTRKYSLISGSDTTKAQVTLNKAIEPYQNIFGSFDANPMADSYDLLISLYRGVESFWGGSYIEDDNGNKFFVVNPTNAEGPNVTSYIPFCDPDDPTVYDPFWMHNHNRFNNEYPAYPDNTPTHELYDQVHCPCLYLQQHYVSEGQIYTYTVMGENQDLSNLIKLYKFRTDNAFIFNVPENYYKLSADKDELRTTDDLFYVASGISGNSVLVSWLKTINNSLQNGYNNGIIPIQKNSNSTYLSIPYGIAYWGFGQNTTLPIYFRFDNEEYLQVSTDEGYVSYKSLIESSGIPSLPREEKFAQTTLLRQSRNTSDGGKAGTNNLEYRYKWGTTNPSDVNYNPFKGTNFIHSVYGLCVSQTSFSTMNYSYIRNYEPDPDAQSFGFEARFWPVNQQIEALNNYAVNHPVAKIQIDAAKEIGYEGTWITNPNLNPFQNLDNQNRPINEVNSYLRDVFQSLNQYTSSSVLGCMDNTALNYNPLATYDLQDPYFTQCTYTISGCLNISILQGGSQTELIDSNLHNYNNYYHSGNINPTTGEPWKDGDLPNKNFGIEYSQLLVEDTLQINGKRVPARLINVNTDDGSCYRIGCMDEQATGEYASGYDPLATVSPESLGLDSLCIYTATPREAILRVVCSESYDGINVCNDYTTETVKVIVDSRDGSINSYSTNFYVEEMPITDSRLLPYRLNFGQDIYGNPVSNLFSGSDLTSFPNTTEDFTIVDGLLSSNNYRYRALRAVFGLTPTSQNPYTARYNCLENPILANGTGGCYLFSYEKENFSTPLEGCSISPTISVSTGGCNSETIFNGGYVTDSSWLLEEFQTIDNNCSFYEPKYIVGGSLTSLSFEANGELVSFPPPLSQHQMDPQVGYSCLDPANPPCPESPSSVPASRIRAVGNVLSDVFLYTSQGEPYIGGIVIEDIDSDDRSRQISAYNIETSSKGSLLYTRNELLRKGTKLDEYEELAKKIREVKEKIINLTIFTDN